MSVTPVTLHLLENLKWAQNHQVSMNSVQIKRWGGRERPYQCSVRAMWQNSSQLFPYQIIHMGGRCRTPDFSPTTPGAAQFCCFFESLSSRITIKIIQGLGCFLCGFYFMRRQSMPVAAQVSRSNKSKQWSNTVPSVTPSGSQITYLQK